MKLFKINRESGDGFARYNAYYGFVICASDEQTVRNIASSESSDEGSEIWLDEKLTKITYLGESSSLLTPNSVILEDFNAG